MDSDKWNWWNGWWIYLLAYFVFWVWIPNIWYSRFVVAIRYTDNMDQVTPAGDKPHDCDWFKSPIGSKECEYSREISTVQVHPNQWGGQSISYDEGKTWIQTAKNKEGDWIISSDGGTTWSMDNYYSGPAKPSVTVTWQRKEWQ